MENQVNITPNEQQILLLLKKGLSNKHISSQTGISVNTVKYHLKNIYKKLSAKNRIDAINKFNEITN
jgi:LuxR family maltose regulon positive regulatory protein